MDLQNQVDQIWVICHSSTLLKAGLIRSGLSDLCPVESWTCPRMACFSPSVSGSLPVLKQPHSKKTLKLYLNVPPSLIQLLCIFRNSLALSPLCLLIKKLQTQHLIADFPPDFSFQGLTGPSPSAFPHRSCASAPEQLAGLLRTQSSMSKFLVYWRSPNWACYPRCSLTSDKYRRKGQLSESAACRSC